jgi:hypothetical protein
MLGAAVFSVLLLSGAAIAAPDFFQGFETDTTGWSDDEATINRTPSGYTNSGGYASGIPSAAGGFHARIRNDGTSGCSPPFSAATICYGPYTDWGDGFGNPTFPAGGYVTEADIYLDVAWAAANPDYRFDWDSSIDDSTGNFLSDVVFNVGTAPTGFVVGTSPNAFRNSTFPSNPCPNPSTSPNTCRVPAVITTSGWYTFQHYFHDDGSGDLRVDMSVLDSTGATVATWFIYPGPTPPTPISAVGGNDYGWFANQEIHDLAVDNTELRTSTNAIKQDIRNYLAFYRSTVTDKEDGKRLDDAIKHLDKSLDPTLWADDTHLASKGNKVFDEEREAVKKLQEIQKDKKSTIPDGDLQGFIDRIVAVDRQLAQTAVDDAAGGNANELDKANDELAKGDAEAAAGKPTNAIDHYKHAWEHAQKA